MSKLSDVIYEHSLNQTDVQYQASHWSNRQDGDNYAAFPPLEFRKELPEF